MKALLRVAAILTCVTQAAVGLSVATACTGITIKPKDGSVVYARTLEFAADTKSDIIIVPRDTGFVGTAPGDKPGLRWKTRYGMVGANAFDLPAILDGINEKGLSVGLFYFPGYASYQQVTTEDAGKALAPWELGIFLLGSCTDVQEAAAAAKDVRVGDVTQKNMGFVPPVHYIVTDATGSSVVIEYIGGELKIFANPLGVVTNSPSFDWHLTNLSNYVNLSVNNVPAIEFDGQAFKSFGQGSGLLGLPGDFTPPSRFVRAVAFSQSAVPVDSARQGVLQAFHILNQFDIPKGSARSIDHGKPEVDYTLWTSAADLKNLRYYFRTFENSRIRVVDLNAVDLASKDIQTISMQGDEDIEDLSKSAKLSPMPGAETAGNRAGERTEAALSSR